VLCGNNAFIHCSQCMSSLLCTLCDEKVHSQSPLHDREAWNGTHFTPLPPTVTIDPQTLQPKTIRMLLHACISLYTIHVHV